jgi:probable HAF family extracellular repeat protein
MKSGASILLILCLAPILSVPASAQEAQPSRYTVTDLGTLGGTFSWATGINNKGWIVGFSTLTGETCVPFPPPPGCDQHAFLWRDGVMTDLGTFGGPNSGVSFWGRRPNERGEVAGAAQTSTPDPAGEDYCAFINNFGSESPAPFQCLPFVWQDGVMTALPTVGGNGSAVQSNNRGVVAGQVDVAPDPACTPQTPRPVPVVWEHGVLQELPVLAGTLYGGPNTVNEKGQAVGVLVSDCAASVASAALWEHGSVTYLGSLGGKALDEGVAINDEGQVVGFASLPGDAAFHAFFWSKGTGMKDLGTLPGDVLSFAAGINGESQIVGTSFDANGNPRAFLEQDGVMIDLNTLIPAGFPLSLLYAFDINSRGEIVGQGFDPATQQLHAYLARPCNDEHANSERCADPVQGAAATSPRRSVGVSGYISKLLRQQRFGRFVAPAFLPH